MDACWEIYCKNDVWYIKTSGGWPPHLAKHVAYKTNPIFTENKTIIILQLCKVNNEEGRAMIIPLHCAYIARVEEI